MAINFARATSVTEDQELGMGGKPPLDRRPTGGGGGDGGGDDDWNDNVNPHPLLDRTRILLAFALTADMLVTVVATASFIGRQTAVQGNLPNSPLGSSWHLALLPPLFFLNAALLMLSCLTVEMARRHIFREIDVLEEWLGLGRPALRRALPWLGGTLALGMVFLAGQALISRQIALAADKIDPGRARTGALFSLAAGTQGIHLALGLLALLFCLCALGPLKRVELRQIAVDAVAWYWHSMGLMWLVLIALLTASQ
jgi:cytochrome c oxidase subunit 3